MSKKTKETKEQQEPVHHEIGDLTLKCGQCGNVEILQEDIPGGISFILGTVENTEVKMKCGECGNEINLTFTGMSDDRDVEYRLKKEEMEEALKQEQEILQAEATEFDEQENDELNQEAAEIEAEVAEEVQPEETEVKAEETEEVEGEVEEEEALAEEEA